MTRLHERRTAATWLATVACLAASCGSGGDDPASTDDGDPSSVDGGATDGTTDDTGDGTPETSALVLGRGRWGTHRWSTNE